MGMTMGEILDLKELAEDCAADKVYEFMFVAPAIPITGAVGLLMDPLAIKRSGAARHPAAAVLVLLIVGSAGDQAIRCPG